MKMTNLEIIKHDLEQASHTNPDQLLRQCISERLVQCDQVFSDAVDDQIRDLTTKFDRLPIRDMGLFIKRLSKSINRHYIDYTQHLIIYRDTLKNSKKDS